jgi:uncharacterized protein (DUF2344 family)
MNIDNFRNSYAENINEVVFLVLKFTIGGTLRFLSHSQMLNVFQRAVVRAGINPQYSHGFNPRPKISLPLPRPVGVESDDELLVMSVSLDPTGICETYKESSGSLDNCYIKHFFKILSSQLPEGCKLQSIEMVREKPSFQPCQARYIFTVRNGQMSENIQNNIDNLLSSESLIIKRSIDTQGRPSMELQDHESDSIENNAQNRGKKIDIRGFLISIITEQNSIIVECKISAAGSIRIPEIMELLGLNTEILACPIKRTNVNWKGEK